MKISEVNINEETASIVGLKEISMKKVGNTILLAGKNGSGKTRILNLIRDQTLNLNNFFNQKQQATNQLDQIKQRIIQQPEQKQSFEQQIQAYQNTILQLVQQILKQPEQKQSFEQQIQAYQNAIIQYEQQISQQPEQKQSFEQQILHLEKLVKKQIPIITENDEKNIIIVDFVPNKIDLEDWSNQSKENWMRKAHQATNLGVSNLHHSTLPLIQQVLDRWINSTHPKLQNSDNDIENSTNNYHRLQSIVKSFLGTEIEWDNDGYTTIFKKPIAKAQLSAGQRVLLQLCVAIYAQGGNLSNHILFMDEPENHLHPSAVIDLLDTIKKHNPNGQIWIATHSIPLLSHFDASSLWFVEEGIIKHSGKKPEEVLKSLLGNEERIQKLKDFTSLPNELARNRFAFECLCSPKVIETDSKDPQSKQLYDQLEIIWKKKETISLLDFGAGKGRMIANLADYENISPAILDYHAYDSSDSEKEHCLKNISLSYSNETNSYHN